MKLFYDHIIDLSEVEKQLKKAVKTPEERDELYQIIDEILHHRLLTAILQKLPKEHHKEFMNRFTTSPHNEVHLAYLSERIQEDVVEFIKQEVRMLSTEILAIIYDKTKPKWIKTTEE